MNIDTDPKGASALDRLLPLLCALLQIAAPVFPSLGVGHPIGAQSESVSTLLTPAGWAFAIWGPLYCGTLVFAVFQGMPAQRANSLLSRVRWPAAAAFFGNAVWAFYVQGFGLGAPSVLIILLTLTCLLGIYRRFGAWPLRFTSGERWCAVLPLSALASWLTVASIVNIAASLRYHGVEGGAAGPLVAAAVLIIGGTIAAAALFSGRGNPPYAMVFLWALSAIFAAGGQRDSTVGTAATVAALLVLGATFVGLRRGGIRRWFPSSSRTEL